MLPNRVTSSLLTSSQIAGIAGLYFITGKLGLLLAVEPGYATAIWPPSGIALVAILWLGYRMWPGIWLGSCLVNVSTSFDANTVPLLMKSLAIPGGIATGAALEAVLGAFLIRRFIGFPTPLNNEREVFTFLGCGGLIGSLASATVGVTTLAVAGAIPWSNSLYSWGTWWIGDTIGVMVVAPILLMLLSPIEHGKYGRRLAVVLPLCITLLLAGVLFYYTSRWEHHRMQLEFERRGDAYSEALHRTFDVHLATLHAIESFHAASPTFTRETFHEFVKGLLSQSPGIHALGWAPLIAEADRQPLERTTRAAGFPHFQILERDAEGRLVRAASRPKYVTVLFLEPQTGNEKALGFDILSDPMRSSTLSTARDSATPVATGRTTLIQETGDQFGFMTYLPLYRPYVPHVTVVDRRENLVGFIAGVFRLGDSVTAALEKVDKAGIDFWLVDNTIAGSEQLLYASRPMSDSAYAEWILQHQGTRVSGSLDVVIPFPIAGRQWTLHLSQTQDFVAANRTWHSWMVLLAALLFTSLFGGFLLVMTGRTSLIEAVVRERTTALSKANQALQQSEHKMRSVTQSANDAIIATDSVGIISSWNRGAECIFGYSEQDIVGKHLRLIMASRSRDLYAGDMNSQMIGKTIEAVGLRSDGQEFPLELTFSTWNTEQGPFYSAIIRDITERKKADAEKALRQTEQSFHALTEAIPQMVWTAAPDGALTYYNQRWHDYTGMSFEQTRGWGWKPVLHPDDLSRTLDRWTEAVRTGGNYQIEYRFLRASDKTYRWHLGRAFPVRADDGTVIKWFGTCTDIHEQKLAEEVIRQNEAKFRRIFESDMFGMVFWKYDGQIVDANDVFLRMVGYSREELSSGMINWKAMTPPEYVEADNQELNQLVATGIARPFEKEYIHKDGRRVPVLIGRTTLDGVPGTGGIAYVFDISERKQAEADRARLLASEEAAREASRLKSEFLANMSHEIRTPLNAVIGMAGLLLDTIMGGEQREYAETIKSSGDALLTLINDILDMSKIEAGKLELEIVDFDARDVVEDVEKTLLLSAQQKGLQLVTNMPDRTSWWLRGDPSRLHQIMMNLVNNAIKFTAKGQVTISVSKTTESLSEVELYCEIRDTGIGIPAYTLDRMFHVFSQADASTTRRFGGSGLGLSICKHLVTLMKGQIGIQSIEGVGSTFWFRIPFAKGQARVPQEHSINPNNRHDHHSVQSRILVVEDNAVNQKIALKMLQKLGYRADAVGNGQEALDVLRTVPYDLIVMDCQMPVMDGYEATAAIRTSNTLHCKNIPIVAMTANAFKSDQEKCLKAGMNDYLAKPVSMDAFAAKLATWLSKKVGPGVAKGGVHSTTTAVGVGDSSRKVDAHLDPRIVSSLRALSGEDDPGFFQTLIDTFVTDVSEGLRDLSALLAKDHLNQLHDYAHQLKGTCANFGATALAKLFGELESAAGSGDVAHLHTLLSQIETEFGKVHTIVTAERGA